MGEIRVAAVIPARMASSRFPGKPLLSVRGLPMVEHVRRRAILCGRFSEVVVATCDEEIAHAVMRHGGKVVMTSPHHPAATDRVAEAARAISCTHVVNVQGDELLVLPSDLERMARAILEDPEAPAWNAVAPIEVPSELRDSSVVKCAVSISGRILFCSRDLSFVGSRLQSGIEPLRKVLGVLGYRRDFLRRYLALPRTPLEVAEGIDQSRILEHDVPFRSVPFSKGYPGLNEPRELPLIERCMKSDLLQQELLKQMLVPAQ